MIEYLRTVPGVIGIRTSGRLATAELLEVMRRLDVSLAEREKTHLFIEVADYHGIELDALAHYLPHALGMLGKLDRFGRVAVVSDARWMRWATKFESALLPHITYETFTGDQRDQALAWVEGHRARAHQPAIRIIETDRPDVVGFELDGKIGAEEIATTIDYFDKVMAQDRPLRLLGRIRHIDGIEARALINSEYIRMKFRALERVERYALVGGPTWYRKWVAVFEPLLKMEIRCFEAAQEADAWAWLDAEPMAERELAA